MDLRQHELNACSQRLAQTTFQQNQQEIEDLKQKIGNFSKEIYFFFFSNLIKYFSVETLEQGLISAREQQKAANAKVKDIEAKLADAKGYRERELKAASDAMKVAKKKSEESRTNWTKREQEYETLRMEIDDIKTGLTTYKTQFEEATENLKKLEYEISGLKTNSKTISEEVSEFKSKIKEQKDKINSQNKEVKMHLTKKEKLNKQNEELQVDIKKKEHEVTKVKNDNKDALNKISSLENKYGWIKEDREFFGTKNTRYDYSKEDPDEAARKLIKMQDQKTKMERNINLKAMLLLEREEEQYKETMRRKKIVEDDKQKIQSIIFKMDEKKKEKVEKVWKIVDENFSSIFSTLLPGAQARLKPVYHSGNNLLGLEIRVGFNGMWKESLGELSGGQRSLVALSLVLAMLKFCPAPLYILDEVDAALDMSHTQNIGNMLKAHFRNSQFIIVSLKDGMFNNANVLFRTKFEEGVSAVTRSVCTKSKQK